MLIRAVRIISIVLLLTAVNTAQGPGFVTVRKHQFILNGKPYYFVGANYWYGSLLGRMDDPKRGVERLRKELDLLKANGVTNLRLMAGAEGSGPMNGVERVGPSMFGPNWYDLAAFGALDLVLAEMGKRQMKAVIFLSNNWEWSGGFQQHLIWQKAISDKWLTKKPTWDELRDNVAKFYSCEPCKDKYGFNARMVINRRNLITQIDYAKDPTIMAWEIANEPRPMRPAANENYKAWLSETAAMIKQADHSHLVTIGHEGRIGTESLELFQEIHADPNVDYLTIHIWPKNWGWFESGKLAEGFPNAVKETVNYINEHAAVTVKLKKPLVIEEFGLPRDGQTFEPASPTTLRDQYFKTILSFVRTNPHIAGSNFWAFGGTARPVKGQLFWKKGDDYTGDPPMEEQGLNSVFDSDRSTWKIIGTFTKRPGRVAP